MDERVLRTYLHETYGKISAIMQNPFHFCEAMGLPLEEGKKKLAELSDLKDRAVSGEFRSRQYVVGVYGNLLSHWMKPKIRGELMNWQEGCNWLLLELILSLDGFPALLMKVGEHSTIGRKEMLDVLEDRREDLEGKIHQESFCRRFLAGLVFAQESGQDVLENLQRQDVDELGALRPDYVYLVKWGRKIRLEGVQFPGTESLLRIQKKASRQARPQYDYNRPALTTEKCSGSRITVAGYHATPTDQELYFNERLFGVRNISLEILQEKYRTIDGLTRELLDLNQKGRGSFLVTGAEMGVGKTTFLLAMMARVPSYWGIGVLDSCNELKAAERYPDKNILTLVESPRLDLEEAFNHMLKTSRDILCVGEVTRPMEMLCLVQGANRLNAGIGGTLHAASPERVVGCCRNLLKASGLYHDDNRAEEELAQALDLIIHLRRHRWQTERIVVDRIVQVSQPEGTMNPGRGDPRERPYRMHTLVSFDDEENRWVHHRLPNEEYQDKICRYVDPGIWQKLQERWEKQI